MNVYPFVEAEQAGQRNVGKACALLEALPRRLLPVVQARAVGPRPRR